MKTRREALKLLLAAGSLPLFEIAAPAEDAKRKRTDIDDAIDRALVFLQRMQEPDGSWKGFQGRNPAITGLAVMAFLSAGHVPGEGRYGDAVERGVRWVLNAQYPNGLIATEGGHEMYQHGICTLMLAEVAGMTEGRLGNEVRQKLEKAVTIVLRAQRKGQNRSDSNRGGWRYRVDGYDSDISVTGWQLMALRSAKNLGCDVPPESIENAVGFIKRCQDSYTGGFKYMPQAHVTVPCTGTSILGLELCGKDQHNSPEVLKAAGYLMKHPPQWGQYHFFYSIYYCSQAMFQVGGSYWDYYRARLHDVMKRYQNENGSWYGQDSEGRMYGPSYCTAMAVLSLTVEYRYLPIYQRDEGKQ